MTLFWIAYADPIWITNLGLLTFKPLLVLGICFKLQLWQSFGMPLFDLSAQRAFSRDFLLASSMHAVIIEDLITCHDNHLEGFDAFSPFTE